MYVINFFDTDSGDLILSQAVLSSSYSLAFSVAAEYSLEFFDSGVLCFFNIEEV